MKHFTPDLYVRYQAVTEEAMDVADADWEKARTRYQKRLERMGPWLPRSLRALLTKFYLHDAEVLSMGRQDHRFLIVLRLDVPPRSLVILNYQLTGLPVIRTGVLPPEHCSAHVTWMYDEVGRAGGTRAEWTHSILLSNGWEVRLRCRSVRVSQAETVFSVAAPDILHSG